MDLQRFFDHWNLTENPFQAEEARNDAVYRRVLEAAIAHPDFAKIYGDPRNPSTTVVFGEKGSGKTAMRLMIERRLRDFNAGQSDGQVWIVAYDELNPMLDRLSHSLKDQDPDRVIDALRLADHQDAILSRAVTELVDGLISPPSKAAAKDKRSRLRRMELQKRLDFATLALLYDQPRHGESRARWHRLKSMLRLRAAWGRRSHGLLTVFLGIVGATGAIGWRLFDQTTWEWITATLVGAAGFAALGIWWLIRAWRNGMRARRIEREIRVVLHAPGDISRNLWDIKEESLAVQPIPTKEDQDSRYNLTSRLLNVLNHLGYSSLVVLLDRIDEPILINGDARRMKQFVWPMMNNKFLQQERMGIKMLLPIEVGHALQGEGAEFKRTARLDKQSVVNPLAWTGEILYDLCSWRFQNCQRTEGEQRYELRDLFLDDVGSEELIEALDQMHQPRDAFKFLYAVVLEHCRTTPGEAEQYQISKATLDYVRREQSRRVVDLYRGTASN